MLLRKLWRRKRRWLKEFTPNWSARSVRPFTSDDQRPLANPGTPSTQGKARRSNASWISLRLSSTPWQQSQPWRRLKTTTPWCLCAIRAPPNRRSRLQLRGYTISTWPKWIPSSGMGQLCVRVLYMFVMCLCICLCLRHVVMVSTKCTTHVWCVAVVPACIAQKHFF